MYNVKYLFHKAATDKAAFYLSVQLNIACITSNPGTRILPELHLVDSDDMSSAKQDHI